MNYDDLQIEYLAAGFLFTVSVALSVTDFLGKIGMLTCSDIGVDSILGVLVLLVLVAVSFPLGYALYRVAIEAPVSGIVLMGRKKVYEEVTVKLLPDSEKTFLTETEEKAGIGFAQGDEFEKKFALVRMFLFAKHPDEFQAIHGYWTRLTRIFAAFSASFGFSGLIFLGAAVLSHSCTSHSQLKGINYVIALVLFALMGICGWCYRKVLKRELEIYIGTARYLRVTS